MSNLSVQSVITAFNNETSKAAVWTQEKALTPIANTTKNVAQGVFVTADQKVFQPIKELIKKVVDWTCVHVLPVVRKIIKAAEPIIAFLNEAIKKGIVWTSDNVLPVVEKNVKKAAVLANEFVLTPVAQKALEGAKFVNEQAVVPAKKWTHKQVVIPAANLVNAIKAKFA